MELKLQTQWNRAMVLKVEANMWDKEADNHLLSLESFVQKPDMNFGKSSLLCAKFGLIRAKVDGLWAEMYGVWARAGAIRAELAEMKARAAALRAESSALWNTSVEEAYGNISMEWTSNGGCKLENGDLYELPREPYSYNSRGVVGGTLGEFFGVEDPPRLWR